MYQIKQEMSTCDYELHFKDKDSVEQNGVNGAGIHSNIVWNIVCYVAYCNLLFFLTAHKNMRKVYVNILSYHEGKQDITNAAHKFCTKVKNKEAQSKIMNTEYLSQLLEGN